MKARRLTVRAEVDGAVSDVAGGGRGHNGNGQVVAIHEGYIVIIRTSAGGEGELGKSCGRNASTSVGITKKTTVAATVHAGVRTGVGAEITVTSSPNTTLRWE